MEKFYNIAGQIIRVLGTDEELLLQEGLLENFRCTSDRFEHEFEFCVVDKLSEPEGSCIYKDADKMIFRKSEKNIRYIGSVNMGIEYAYLRIERQGNQRKVEVKKNSLRGRITSKIVLSAFEAEHLILQANGFILHASYIVYEGQAILFTAPSETGKSTQADLWKNLRGAEIINGDRAVVKKTADNFVACGIPYAGSSKIALQGEFPLAAIVYLSQEKETVIKRLTGVHAFRSVWEGISVNCWDKKDVNQVSNIVTELLVKVPVYHLACTPDESAVNVLENLLKE